MVRDNKVLLARRAPHRKDYPNRWDFIGGRIETGETPQATLTRELGEELAISPKNAVFLKKMLDRHLRPDDPPTYWFFKVTEWVGKPVIANDEHSALNWFTLAQMQVLPDLADRAYLDLATEALSS